MDHEISRSLQNFTNNNIVSIIIIYIDLDEYLEYYRNIHKNRLYRTLGPKRVSSWHIIPSGNYLRKSLEIWKEKTELIKWDNIQFPIEKQYIAHHKSIHSFGHGYIWIPYWSLK